MMMMMMMMMRMMMMMMMLMINDDDDGDDCLFRDVLLSGSAKPVHAACGRMTASWSSSSIHVHIIFNSSRSSSEFVNDC